MPKCRDCRWARLDLGGDPTKGTCIYGETVVDEKETSSGTRQAVMPGRVININAEACEHFEKKVSRKQFLAEGW